MLWPTRLIIARKFWLCRCPCTTLLSPPHHHLLHAIYLKCAAATTLRRRSNPKLGCHGSASFHPILIYLFPRFLQLFSFFFLLRFINLWKTRRTLDLMILLSLSVPTYNTNIHFIRPLKSNFNIIGRLICSHSHVNKRTRRSTLFKYIRMVDDKKYACRELMFCRKPLVYLLRNTTIPR